MLQYTVHPPLISFSNAPKKLRLKSVSLNTTFAHPAPARRPLTSPSALSQQRPPDDVPSNRMPGVLSLPFSISTSISSSSLPSPSFPPTSFAKQVPHPPFMPSSRQQSTAIPTSRLNNAHSRKDSASSSVIADVLAQGNIVGGGIPLQREPIRLVSIQARSSVAVHEQPAQEFEVIRKLGTGSYAVVYLVREVLSHSAPSDDNYIYPGGRLELDELALAHGPAHLSSPSLHAAPPPDAAHALCVGSCKCQLARASANTMSSTELIPPFSPRDTITDSLCLVQGAGAGSYLPLTYPPQPTPQTLPLRLAQDERVLSYLPCNTSAISCCTRIRALQARIRDRQGQRTAQMSMRAGDLSPKIYHATLRHLQSGAAALPCLMQHERELVSNLHPPRTTRARARPTPTDTSHMSAAMSVDMRSPFARMSRDGTKGRNTSIRH
ncbi:hypothetical protein EW146_g576 [Bondarzewia mesenterica]|uniref:Uncharacterized protein n=1 Tax=Bondarzewia mesenterica TaxID=1095465 RepID=A0A4S4M8B9_9AGAM|nr:hypothetical protein EW146_g576 [Bondarzewia mesenterica]